MNRHTRQGAAPLLWVLAVLAVLFLLVERVIHSLEVEETIAETNRLERLAEMGFQNTIVWARWYLERDARLEVEDEDNPPFDSLIDEWNIGPTMPYWSDELPELLVRWRLVDGHSKFNINTLVDANGVVSDDNRLRLTNMLVEFELNDTEQLTASLCDWIDREPPETLEGEASRDLNNFEQGARNAPLTVLAELAMVPGYTDEVLWGNEEEGKLGVAPWVTLHNDGKINPNTAPAWVIMGADQNISRMMATSLVEGRAQNPYKTIDDVIAAAGTTGDLNFEELFTVSSSYFILEMEADYNGRLNRQRAFLYRDPSKGLVSVLRIERDGFFQWDDDIKNEMKEAELDLLEEIKEKNIN